MPVKARPLRERIAGKYIEAEGCWLWTGTIAGGYGKIAVDGRQKLAHRVVYELLVGPIPAERDLDHLCRVPHCVNPAHLEPVTRAENLRRGAGHGGALWDGRHPQSAKTHCPKGHAYDEANTCRSNGRRFCRTCHRVAARARRARRKAANA